MYNLDHLIWLRLVSNFHETKMPVRSPVTYSFILCVIIWNAWMECLRNIDCL